MVGVPGRSKGCQTCRRRKKGCDKRKPSCWQCVKAGLTCGGYDRDTVWVNASSDRSKINAVYSKPKRDSQIPFKKDSSDTSSDITLHYSLVQSAREEKYVGLYWSEYLFRGRKLSSEASEMSTGGWTRDLPDLYDTEPALRYSILALSVSMLAGAHNDGQLRMKGLQTYTTAVREMGLALQSPQRSKTDGLLAAVRLLAFYEILYGKGSGFCEGIARSSQVEGWKTHSEGHVALFLQRGPDNLVDGPGHHMFIDGRLGSFITSLAARKQSPLSLPEWKRDPWKRLPKRPVDRLLDILIDLPGFLEELDFLRANHEHLKDDLRQRDLLNRCQLAIRHMQAWRAGMGGQLSAFDYTIVGIPVPVPTQDVDLALLHLNSLYWMGCILLVSTYHFVVAEYRTRTTQVGDVPIDTMPDSQFNHVLTSEMDPLLNAYKIARSVHLFFQPHFGAYAIKTAIFPLGVALRYLIMAEPMGQLSEERRLLISVFTHRFLGTSVGNFLNNLQQDAPSRELREMHGDEGRWARARQWWGHGNALRPVSSGMA